MNAIKARMRPELVLTEHHNQRGRYWIVEDPVGLKYFRLRDEECFVLKSLANNITLVDLKKQFNKHFHPLNLGLRQLNRFLFHLHDLGLIVSDNQGQGEILSRRNRTNRRKRVLSSLANPLAIRMPGIAADRWIDRIYPKTKVLFSRPAITLWILLVTMAVSLVTVNFGAFQSRLPSFADFFSPTGALWFAVAVMISKALHELGHALVSKHLGGNCREIGVIFLAFVPTLYCDVSDVWRMHNRWHRILVSMAGIFAELILAALVTFVWWFSEPGEIQTLALHILFFCSVSTFVFNINPLVRCDGYYVLSDLTDTPNLWQESRGLWRRATMGWFSDKPMEIPQQIPSNHVVPLMAYAAASTLYCWGLIVGILWMTFRILEPYGLASLAWTLIGIVAIGYLGPSAFAFAKLVGSPVRRRSLRVNRVAAASVVGLLVGSFLFMVPLTHRISAPLVIELRDARPIFATVAGKLEYAVPDQTIVTSGDRLVELENDEIDLRIAEAADQVTQHQHRLENLQKLLLTDPSVSPLIPSEQQALADSKDRLNLWQQDRDRLVLNAPIDGIVFSPPALANEASSKSELGQWSGTPLAPENLGSTIQVGQLVCLVGKPGHFRGNVLIAQADVAGVRRGQEVVMRIEQLPSRLFHGSIADVSKADAKGLPVALMRQLGLQPTDTNRKGEIYYQATIHFDAQDVVILQGMTGRVKISSDSRTLARRIADFFSRHFTFDPLRG
jgi:putative peptide zinc metalloprotease protein